MAALGEAGQVLADRDAGGAGVDGGEFAANVFRGVGLGIEAVVLPKAAREEDVDDRPMATGREMFSVSYGRAFPRQLWLRV